MALRARWSRSFRFTGRAAAGERLQLCAEPRSPHERTSELLYLRTSDVTFMQLSLHTVPQR